MNLLSNKFKLDKLYDLNNQIFDYIQLTIYDLESKIDQNKSLKNFQLNLETFSDKHFKNALNEFIHEIQKIKNDFPEISYKIETYSTELKNKFNSILNSDLLDLNKIDDLKSSIKHYLDKIK